MTKPRKSNNDGLPASGPAKQQTLDRDIDLLAGAALSMSYVRHQKPDMAEVPGLLQEIEATYQRVQTGNLADMEKLLVAQIYTLNSLFNQCLALGMSSGAQITGMERYLALAFRTQDQTRKTVLALNELKNPRRAATFIKQQIGQQVSQQLNVMLENDHAQMDPGSQVTSVTAHPELAALDSFHRPTIGGRAAEELSEQPQTWLP